MGRKAMDFKQKLVLVTGADGFIGSHLVEALLKRNCKVRAFVYYNAFNSWGWLDTFNKSQLKKIEIFPGDIRDPNCVRKAIKGIEVVFHLAALVGIPFSYHSPDSYVDTNIKGTLNILQASLKSKINRILVTSSSEVYGTVPNGPITEAHPLNAQSPYSATKIAADKIAESFFKSFDSPITIVRPFNTFGPRQSARAIIPTIITQLFNGAKEVKLGALEPKRDFNYVKDICDGFLAIADSDKSLGIEINIASGRAISIRELAEIIIKKINPKSKIVLDSQRLRPKESEVMELLGSNKRIKELTSWRPRYSLEEGLDETIEWFRVKNNFNKYKADSYNI